MVEKEVKAIIFDCDGTLLDSERIYMSTWNMVANPMGYTLPEELLLSTRGKSLTVGRRMYLDVMGEDFPFDEIFEKRQVVNEEVFYSMRPEEVLRPGVLRLLNWLKEQGIKIAVASAKTYKMTSEHLKHAGVFDMAEVVLGKDMVKNNKPAPDLFLKAAEMLGVAPEECFVVGDTISDVGAAYAAGIRMAFVSDLIPVNDEIIEKSYVQLNQIDELIEVIQKKR